MNRPGHPSVRHRVSTLSTRRSTSESMTSAPWFEPHAGRSGQECGDGVDNVAEVANVGQAVGQLQPAAVGYYAITPVVQHECLALDVGEAFGELAISDPDNIHATHVPVPPVVAPAHHGAS